MTTATSITFLKWSRSGHTFWDSVPASERVKQVNQTRAWQIGNLKAWEADDRVLQHWHDRIHPLADTVWESNKSRICRGIDWTGKFEFMCWMIGPTPDSAKPALVIRIADRLLIKRFGRLMLKHQTFKASGFAMRGQEGNIIHNQAGGKPDKRARDPQPFDINPSVPVKFAKLNHKSSRHMTLGETVWLVPNTTVVPLRLPAFLHTQATMGPIVVINDSLYGLMAAHSFLRNAEIQGQATAPEEIVDLAKAKVYDESFFESDGSDDTDFSDSEYRVFDDTDLGNSLHSPVLLACSIHAQSPESSRGLPGATISTEKIGAFQTAPHDVPFSRDRSGSTANLNMDWALIRINDRSSFELRNAVPNGPTIDRVSDVPPHGTVMIVSKVGKNRLAYCSGALTSISLRFTEKLIKVYTLSSDTSALAYNSESASTRGESGALVIDPQTGNAYGMVVAKSDDLGITYMIPLKDIFENISQEWGADVKLRDAKVPKAVQPLLRDGKTLLFKLSPGHFDDEVVGTFRNVDLEALFNERDEKFEFVSYSTRSDGRTRNIRVETQLIAVPEALYDALKALRLRNRSRVLWADAICIDMSSRAAKDLTARDHALYPVLVNSASKVCAWLGRANAVSEECCELISRNRATGLESVEELDPGQRTRLWKFMSNPWFLQRWTVQEVGYAKKVTLHCGSTVLPWEDFIFAIELFKRIRSLTKFGGELEQLPAIRLLALVQSLFTSTSTGTKQPRMTLDQVVQSMAYFESANERDSIYSALSLARCTGWALIDRRALFPAEAIVLGDLKRHLDLESVLIRWRRDVSRNGRMKDELRARLVMNMLDKITLRRIRITSVQEINGFLEPRTHDSGVVLNSDEDKRHNAISAMFKRRKHLHGSSYEVEYRQSWNNTAELFVQKTICSTQSLDIICRPWAPVVHDHAIPTWVPNITHAEYQTLPQTMPTRANGVNLVNSGYHAGGKYHERQTPIVTHERLHSTGMLKVYGVSLAIVKFDAGMALMGNIPSGWRALTRCADTPGPNDIPQILWRTLAADRDDKGERAPAWYADACALGLSMSQSNIDVQRLLDLDDGNPAPGNMMLNEYFTRVRKVIWNRRMVRLSDGRTALVPGETQVGDHVKVLYGCSVPVVLRLQKDQQFSLIGECFVLGVMEGEILSENLPDEVFSLV